MRNVFQLPLKLSSLFVEPRARLLAMPADPGVAEIAIDGLVCGICAARVQSVLCATPGVDAATCELGSSRAIVRFDPRLVDPRDLPQRVESAVILMQLRRRLARFSRARRTGIADG